mgnify:CR=1 FL=1
MGKFFMKKVVPVVLIIAMMFTMFTMTSFAAEGPAVSMTASEIVDGKFTVTVSVANNPGIDSFAWKLGYDATFATPVYDVNTFWGEVVSGGTLETNLADTNYVTGTPVSAVFAKEDGTTANGKVFAVDFQLTDKAYGAELNFTLDIADTVSAGAFGAVEALTVAVPAIEGGEGEGEEEGYEKAEKPSTITLIPGGINKSQTINYEYVTYVLPEGTDYVREGYTFAGWTADKGATILAAGTEYAVTGNVVFEVVWSKSTYPTTWVYYHPGEVVSTISYNYASQNVVGRNSGDYFFTEFPAIEGDFFKAEYKNYGRHRNGYYRYNLYPVTAANFAAAFGEYTIADNLNATGIELDPTTFVFPTLETKIYTSATISSTPDPHTWLEGHDITSFVKENANGFILANTLTGGEATTEGLRLSGKKAAIVTYHLPEEEDTTGRAVITFDANGGEGSITRIVADAGDEIVLPTEGFTLTANKLAGWTDGKKEYALGATYTVAADAVLKAVWEYQGGEVTLAPVATYHVSVPSTGDAVVKATTGQVNMASGTASDPAGNYYIYNVYDLTGFRNIKSAIINKTVNKIVRKSSTSFAPVTSQWPAELTVENLADITVGANIASGELSQSSNKVDGAYVPFTDTFDITEYVAAYEGDILVIREWATNWDYTRPEAERGGTSDTYSPKAADTITLITGTEYMVSFDANGGVGTVPATAFGELTLPECELTNGGLAFVGWNDGSKTYSAGTVYTPKKDVVLKAVWGQGVTLTFDDNGTITTETVGVGGSVILPEGAATTTVGTLTFVGWKYANEILKAGETVKADISKTYTAVYDYVGGEGNLAWVESWYFANPAENKVVVDTVNGTLTKDPTAQKNLFRNNRGSTNWVSAYFAKIDISGLRNVKSAALNVYHTKFNNAVTAAVYDITEADYNKAFANAETGAFLTADLPTGTRVASQSFAVSSTIAKKEPILLTSNSLFSSNGVTSAVINLDFI